MNENGFSLLHAAVANRNVTELKRLLRTLIDVNSQTTHSTEEYRAGTAPLHIAARLGDVESVKLLLDFGADIDAARNFRFYVVLFEKKFLRFLFFKKIVVILLCISLLGVTREL